MTQKYEVGKWYGWNGGKCPLHPKTEIEYLWLDEFGRTGVTTALAGPWANGDRPAWECQLKAFRILKEHREPREWWVHPGRGTITAIPMNTDYGWIHVREVMKEDEE